MWFSNSNAEEIPKRFLLGAKPCRCCQAFFYEMMKISVTVICNFLGDSDVYGKAQENNGLLKRRIKVEIYGWWMYKAGCTFQQILLKHLFLKFALFL